MRENSIGDYSGQCSYDEQHLRGSIAQHRKAAGISTRVLAKALQGKGFDISHATIANYERGMTLPSLAAIAAIADIYGLAVNWFLQADSVLTNVCYRALTKVNAKEKRRFEGMSQRWLDGYRRLEIHLGQGLQNDLSDFCVREGDTGKRTAERLRERLGLANRPVPSTIDVLHHFGVRVLTMDASPGIDGLAAKLDQEPVVVLTSGLSNDRIRLDAVHELGHHLYSDSQSGNCGASKQCEELAFEFGSHFLMPVDELRAAFEGYSMLRLIEYKRRYGISLAAMIYRARKEKILPERIYTMLWREFAKRGWRRTEPGDVVADRPVRFEQMLEASVQSGTVTWAEAAEITRIREDELRARVAAAITREFRVSDAGGECS